MTPELALVAFRARWSHASLDRRDVEERVAVRLGEASVEVLVVATPPACRLFVRSTAGAWRSRYVHGLRDVDVAIAELAA